MSSNEFNDPHNIENLQENFNKQQVKISALKELARKSEAAHDKSTSSAQEKVRSIAQRLTHLKSKARAHKSYETAGEFSDNPPIMEESITRKDEKFLSPSTSEKLSSDVPNRARSETPGSEKIQLLRQQMEENKLRIAKKKNDKRELEEKVTQLKARFDSTQQTLEKSSELGKSVGDLSCLTSTPISSKFNSTSDLSFSTFNLDKEKIKFLENRVRLLDKQLEKEKEKNLTKSINESENQIDILQSKILDLQENLKEKDSIMEAKTKAISLMTTNFSEKSKNTVDILEDTRQEMFKMQKNFLDIEENYKIKIEKLLHDLEEKIKQNEKLEETNRILEKYKTDLKEEIKSKDEKIYNLNDLTENLQKKINDLENKLCESKELNDVQKIGEEYAEKIQSLQNKVESLEKENVELQDFVEQQKAIHSEKDDNGEILKNQFKLQIEEMQNLIAKIKNLEEQLTEKTVECNVLNANFSVLQEKLKATTPKSLFPKSADEGLEMEINRLKNQLDESNKSMIKMKLKTKQLQKEVDSFKKISNVHAEVIRLTEENQQLQQKVVDLEEEKGKLLLKLSTGETGTIDESELEMKIQILETTCQNQTSAIQLLEEQKLDMTQNLNTTKLELKSLKDHIHEVDKNETARVVSQMEAIQLEEQIVNYTEKIKELNEIIHNQKSEIETFTESLKILEHEKSDLSRKIDHYIAENMELLDKIEKLSKSSSSAESIEIVERLTQQEKLEIEAFNKELQKVQLQTEFEMKPNNIAPSLIDQSNNDSEEQELNESLVKLREESSELMHKIELFTTERREVLEKMECLMHENHENIQKINQLTENKMNLEQYLEKMKNEVEDMKIKYNKALLEKENLEQDLCDLRSNEIQIVNELNLLTKEKNSLKENIPDSNVIDDCEKCLLLLNAEIENYKKSNDKSGKLNTSRKLVKEAKNVYKQMNGLLEKLKSVSTVAYTKTGGIEKFKNASNLIEKCIELENIIEDVKKEFDQLNKNSEKKDLEIQKLTSEVNNLHELSGKIHQLMDENVSYHEKIDDLQGLRRELENKLHAYDSEINILKTLVAEQKEQLINSYTEHEAEISDKLETIKRYETEVENLKAELEYLRSEKTKSCNNYNDQLQKSIEELQNILKNNEILIAEQSNEMKNKQDTIDTMNKQIIDLYETIEENTKKMTEKEDEIVYIQELLDSNRNELNRTIKENDENKKVIEKLLLELHSYTDKFVKLDTFKSIESKNIQLEARVQELEKMNAAASERNKEQHEKLKKFAANLKKKVAQCNELEEKVKNMQSTMQESKLQLTQTDNKSEQTLSEYKMKVSTLENSFKEYQIEYNALKSSLVEQTQRYNAETLALRNENQILSTQLQEQSDNYQLQVENLQQECDNLKREQIEFQTLKTMLHKQLEEKQQTLLELQSQMNANMQNTREMEEKLNSLASDLNAKNVKLDKCKIVIKEKNKEIHRLLAEKENMKQLQVSPINVEINSNLQNEFEKLKKDYSELVKRHETEKAEFQNTITKLETVHGGIQAKLQEDLGYIESLEIENNKYKEKISKLESCLAVIEERRASLERHTKLLDSQLQRKADEYEKNEDALVHRLNMLSDHDDYIGRRLLEAQEEKEELMEKLDHMKQDYNDLMQKFSSVEKEFQHFKNEDYESLKAENQLLKQQIEVSRNEVTRIQQNFDFQLAKKHAEIDELENELSIQLQVINGEKRSLQENLEKANDEIAELKDEIVKLKENVNALEQNKSDLERENTWTKMQNENLMQDQIELQELRTQVVQDKTEIDNLTHQLDTFMQNHEIELNALRIQISELDSMRMQVSQNQTDDQVFIETENKKLKELLAEKDAIIENYQMQNLQLQMAVSTALIPQDPFYNITESVSTSQTDDQFSGHIEITSLREKIQKLEAELIQTKAVVHEKDDQIKKHLKDNSELREELNEVKKKLSDLQTENESLKEEFEQTNNRTHEISSVFSNTEQQAVSCIFDDLFASSSSSSAPRDTALRTEVQDQKKIEDLERNVSDLEKYANELENKLKHLTAVHEDSMHQLHEKSSLYEETVKNYEEKLHKLEEKIIELQIVDNIENLNENRKKVKQNLQQSNQNIQSSEPVVEEPIIPKTAYVCQPDLNDTVLLEVNEDWAWGSEDANLEAKHCESTLTGNKNPFNTEKSLQLKLKEYQQRIQELELERNRLEEQKVELQVKSGKMMKKLKEYKTKLDQFNNSSSSFRKSSSVESNDLDLAIQEELKSQLEISEKTLSNMKKQLEKELTEKENLLKRIDVLTQSNERLIEMKENQDVSVQNYQQEISKLNEQIKNLRDWSNPSDRIKKHEVIIDNGNSNTFAQTEENIKNFEELKRELEDLKVDRDELQTLLNEEKETNRMNENKIKDLQEKILALEERFDNYKKDKEQTINDLRLTNQNLQSKLNECQTTINRISDENRSIKIESERLNDEYQKKMSENDNLIRQLEEYKSQKIEEKEDNNFALKIQELNSVLQYKDDEICHLKQKIGNLLEKENQVQLLIEENSKQKQYIARLTRENELLINENVEKDKKLAESVPLSEHENKNSEDEIKFLQNEIKNHQIEKTQMEEELRVLNNHVMANLGEEEKMKQIALELDLKNIEIIELKNYLEILKSRNDSQKENASNENSCEEKLKELDNRWKAIVEQKCEEIANSWRKHLEIKEAEFKQIEKELREKLNSTTLQSDKNADKNIESKSDQEEVIKKMQSALESQEIEIVTLKEQLAIRSAEYARLAARHDPYGQTTSNTVFQSKPQKGVENVNTVPKSELDLALYILHQREMRCEELTLELVNLVEERDTLQLKLSNSLRRIEEIKQKTGYVESGSDTDPGPSYFPDSPVKSTLRSDNQNADENISQDNDLNVKLSQLHPIGLAKDKRLREERNQRQRQMEHIQQDIANIPSEAVSELVGSNSSNIIESPSTVLLNWLWGKSNSS